MRHIVTGIILLIATIPSPAQSKQYVCPPCGSRCDREVHNKAGTCRSCGMTLVEKTNVTVEDLTLKEVCDRIEANPKLVLLDVRSRGEFAGSRHGTYGHFKNAINVNIDDLESRVGELEKYKNDEIIVYCSHSQRSPRATYFLLTQGFTNVKNMAGGVSTFRRADECLNRNFVFH